MQLALLDVPVAPLVDRWRSESPLPRVSEHLDVRWSETSPVLNRGTGHLRDYDFAVNSYRGCQFGCSYCYAALFVPDEQDRKAWGRWVVVKERSVAQVRSKQIDGLKLYMSSATDPYQPIERELELTRGLLEEFLAKRTPPRLVIQTRSPLVTRDIDLLARFPHVRVNVSITTDNEEVRKRFEPSCPSISRRLAAVRELREAGIKTHICVSPMLPIHNPARFAEQLRASGANAVVVTGLHEGDTLFAAGTRPEGVAQARQLGHGRDRVSVVLRELGNRLDNLVSTTAGFGPE
ncbi:MAG: radical SAM protein [Methanoregulaceae archaeon]|nr:radical SAM protein [Methanoregulaceae archaeon]